MLPFTEPCWVLLPEAEVAERGLCFRRTCRPVKKGQYCVGQAAGGSAERMLSPVQGSENPWGRQPEVHDSKQQPIPACLQLGCHAFHPEETYKTSGSLFALCSDEIMSSVLEVLIRGTQMIPN